MASQGIEEFAKILVRHVRDAAIHDCDMDCRPECGSVGAKRWRAAGITESALLARIMIPDCIDAAIFWLLDAIDQGTLKLQYIAEDGSVVDLAKEGLGELGGWYVGNDGWRQRYSEVRLNSFVRDED